MRIPLLLLAALVAVPFANAQTGTFEFNGGADNGADVTETVDGVTLTVTESNGNVDLVNATLGPVSGNIAGVATGYANNTLTLTFSAAVNITNMSFITSGDGTPVSLTITPSSGPVVNTSFPGSTSGGGTVTEDFTNVTSLSIAYSSNSARQFFIDNIEMDGSLPVELTGFTAHASGAAAVLAWQTASETNNTGFDVQIADAGSDVFRSLGFVAGSGTTLEAQTYGFVTRSLAPGTYAFRLKQIDLDGASEFGPTVEVTIAAQGDALTAAPGVVTLTLERAQPVRVALYDALGRRAAHLHTGAANQTQTFALPQGLPSGVYFVRAEGEGVSLTRSVVVTR